MSTDPARPSPHGQLHPTADPAAAEVVTGVYPTVPDPDVLAGGARGDRGVRARAPHERRAGPPRVAHDRRAGDGATRRAAERRLAAVVEGMSEAFLSLDAGWRVTYANQAACALAGAPRAALLGCDHWQRWPETRDGQVEREYRRVVREGVPSRFEHYYPGAGVWHAIQAYPAEGGGLAIFYRDVTAEKAAAAEREQLLAESERARGDAEAARAEAEAANRSKGRFLATMSHELRTPLNAIAGYVQILEMGIRGPLTGEQRHDLGRIQASQRHLLGLINEVLSYAKLETGTVRYEVADVALGDVLAAAEALVAPQARARGLALAICAPGAGGAGVTARADPEKVRQVLVNLLSNAVKFTEAGGRVDVTCGADAAPAGAPGRVRVVVRDTGVGIPADQLEAVFEPFVQVADARTGRVQEGTGLGLAISRELARGMGGDLTAESAPGAGSAFTLTLPAAPPAA